MSYNKYCKGVINFDVSLLSFMTLSQLKKMDKNN